MGRRGLASHLDDRGHRDIESHRDIEKRARRWEGDEQVESPEQQTQTPGTHPASPAREPNDQRDCEAVINRAIEVIGDKEDAMRWLGTPVRALDYATPISRLSHPEGETEVLRVLTQLEHGVL
jgi:Protein of unknown function (DUF2384)